MAMLRNLRNLIFTGVHPKYHRWVMNKLMNENAVANSKQFPTRFFSAYEAIPKDIEDFKAKLTAMNSPKDSKDKKKDAPDSKETQRRAKKKIITPAYMPSVTLFQEYREALDKAVKIATIHNIKPIRGSTVVFVNSSAAMQQDCSTAKGMGAIRKLNEVATLLGLMCKYACEDCEMRYIPFKLVTVLTSLQSV
jgi:telomerase protein component 1